MKFNLIFFKKILLNTIIPVAAMTFIMFDAYFFSDKVFSFKVIRDNMDNPKMYLCLLIAFLAALMLHTVISKRIF